ncbi:MAG: AAA family ATPase [Elusimicrobia bacterium]|nr:AAA family ATPase [Elusimicrobiota bacterium]
MYLKAVEITGFKSFADTVRLDLQRGITCIVGPNGCGKSNIVDSIRWTIGEMSWKSLRSASMVDIIFNGTAKRPPQSMAEVNMIFDNDSRRLKLDFPEVVVTRKIFRSGESEYFLNKVQCRLRDIRDLFLDTGIGGEGYAIIDQGGIEFILSSTPEQRREIFEEAAGVSKYKSKRDEAQRKLEKVDQDLARLMDSVSLIEEQVKKLDSEARKAKLYQKYREELKSCEIAMSLRELDAHSAEMEKSAAELSPLSQSIADKTTRLTMLEGETSALNLNLTHKQAEFNKLGEKIASAKYQIGLLEGSITNFVAMTEELSRQITNFNSDEANAEKRLAEINPAIHDIKAKIDALEEQIAPLQAEYEKRVSRYNVAESEINALSREQDSINAEIMKSSQSEMECSNKIALEESGIRHLADNLINAEKEKQKISAEKETLKLETEKLSQDIESYKTAAQTVRQEVAQLQSKKTELLSFRDKSGDGLLSVRSEKASLSATLEMLRAQAGNDPYWVGAQTALKSGISGIRGTLRRNISFNPQYAMFFEEAMGRFLDAVVCDTRRTALTAIKHLKDSSGGRCRFIILDEAPRHASGRQGLMEKITCPKEFEGVISTLLANASLENSEVSGNFWIVGGAEKAASPEPYWGKEDEIELKLKSAGEKESRLVKSMEENSAEISATEAGISELNAKLNEAVLGEGGVFAALKGKEDRIKFLDDCAPPKTL